MAKVVVIGAGLTGLSTAYHLEQNGFFDYKIFEQETAIGGLCRSIEQDGFTFDYTGHLLHISDPYFRTLIEKTVGLKNLQTISRRSFIYSHGTHTKFPFQINLHGLPSHIIVECIEEFIKKPKIQKNPKTFYQWAHQNFGSGITKHFFVPYQQKIFSYDIHKITASWTGRFVPQTSLKQILYGSLEQNNKQDVGYNAHFLYPKQGGIYFWINAFAKHIKNKIYTTYRVETIDMANRVITFTNGDFESFEYLVSTMPLDHLLSSLREKPSTHIRHAQRKLLCNSVVNINLGIGLPNLCDKHWIYLPEKKFPFYRVGFYHNFSSAMTPYKHSSLYAEYSHINKSEHHLKETTRLSINALKKLFNFSDKDIVTRCIKHISHAYVIYDFWREKNIKKLHNRLYQHKIYSIGRYGAWKYASMQESVLDGKVMAEHLLGTQTTKYVPAGKASEILVSR